MGYVLMANEKHFCCICGVKLGRYGYDPDPVKPGTDKDGKIQYCCDTCYEKIVIPAKK